MKGRIYRSCVRSAVLYGSETWCLKENEMSILRRTERAMVRAMCGVKLKDRESSEELMDRLGLKVRVEQLAKANGVRWYGHVLRREKDDVLRRALAFEVDSVRERTTEEDMEEASGGGHQEDQTKEGRRSKSRKVERWCREDCERNEVHPATPVDGDKTGLKLVMDG